MCVLIYLSVVFEKPFKWPIAGERTDRFLPLGAHVHALEGADAGAYCVLISQTLFPYRLGQSITLLVVVCALSCRALLFLLSQHILCIRIPELWPFSAHTPPPRSTSKTCQRMKWILYAKNVACIITFLIPDSPLQHPKLLQTNKWRNFVCMECAQGAY